jgi:hypothetical protein
LIQTRILRSEQHRLLVLALLQLLLELLPLQQLQLQKLPQDLLDLPINFRHMPRVTRMLQREVEIRRDQKELPTTLSQRKGLKPSRLPEKMMENSDEVKKSREISVLRRKLNKLS